MERFRRPINYRLAHAEAIGVRLNEDMDQLVHFVIQQARPAGKPEYAGKVQQRALDVEKAML